MEDNIKMVFYGVQIIGIIFFVVMIYLSYVYYKRKNYSLRSFIAWLIVWLALMFFVAFPQTIYGVMEVLQIERTADFFVMSGFAAFLVIIFYLFMIVKKNNARMEELVRKIAIMETEKKQPKKKENECSK